MKLLGYEISKFKKAEPKSKVVAGKSADLYGQSGKQETLSAKQLRYVAEHESLFYKATHKKNRDALQNWFIIKKLDDSEPFKEDVRIINEFQRRTRMKQKSQVAGVSKDIYGDGFIEKIYLETKGRGVESPPPKNAEPIGLKVLDAEHITTMKVVKGQKYYVYRATGVDDKLIHPSRIMHFREGLPYSDFGLSKVESLKNILKSVMNTDTATGEILDWSSHGILDFTIVNSSPEQEKYMNKLVKEGNHWYIHDENYELKVENPRMGEPKSFFDYFYVKIAAMFEMPQHVLTGVQPGKDMGGETGIADYHKDLRNDQDMTFTPLFEDLFEELLNSKGRKWQYKLVWLPTYVDETSEANIMWKRALAAKESYLSEVIGQKESRKIIKDGIIDFDPDTIPDDIKEVEEPAVGVPGSNPTAVPKKTAEKKENVWRPLTEREKERIAELKQLGEDIIKEQDDRGRSKGDRPSK